MLCYNGRAFKDDLYRSLRGHIRGSIGQKLEENLSATSINQFCWFIFFKNFVSPSGGGAANGGGGVMGVVVDFVSCLSSGTMRLIETSVALDDVSLHHVINALTNLSQEAMEIAYSNRVRFSSPKTPKIRFFYDFSWSVCPFLGAVPLCRGETARDRAGEPGPGRDLLETPNEPFVGGVPAPPHPHEGVGLRGHNVSR